MDQITQRSSRLRCIHSRPRAAPRACTRVASDGDAPVASGRFRCNQSSSAALFRAGAGALMCSRPPSEPRLDASRSCECYRRLLRTHVACRLGNRTEPCPAKSGHVGFRSAQSATAVRDHEAHRRTAQSPPGNAFTFCCGATSCATEWITTIPGADSGAPHFARSWTTL